MTDKYAAHRNDPPCHAGHRRCSKGYDPPTGSLEVHDRKARAVPTSITGVEIERGETYWKTADCYRVDASDLFDNQPDCLRHAALKAEAAEAILAKAKDVRHKPTAIAADAAHTKGEGRSNG